MQLYMACLLQVCILLRIASVLAIYPVHILQDTVLQDMGWKNTREVSSKTHFIPDVSDDEDTMAAGSGMDSPDNENGWKAELVSCCILGKIAGKAGSSCRTTSHGRNLGSSLRPVWYSKRQLSHISAPTHACILGSELEFYKCCFAAKRERFERSQWVRSRRVLHGMR